jgi:hypothetical protein
MQNYLQTTEVPTISLWAGVCFGLIVTAACSVMSYKLGDSARRLERDELRDSLEDCQYQLEHLPARDSRGRFKKRK